MSPVEKQIEKKQYDIHDVVYDLVIYGDGFAAAGAALAAARKNLKVLIVSPCGYVGSEITVSFLPVLKKGVCASADMLAENLEEANALHEERADSTACQVRLFDLLEKAGVEILFYERPSGVIAEDETMQAVIFAGKNGLMAVRGKTFIDVSGKLEVIRFAAPEKVIVPECDWTYNLKYQLLDGASEIPDPCSPDIHLADSCWAPEKIIEIRNGRISSIRPVISRIKSLDPSMRNCVMTGAAFRGCCLQNAFIQGELPFRNLFAPDCAEVFTFENHDALPAERMKTGEELSASAE